MKRIIKHLESALGVAIGIALVTLVEIAVAQDTATWVAPGGLVGVDLSSTPTAPEYQQGVPYAGNEGFYLYGKATEAITAGQWVFIDEANQYTLMDTTESGTEQMRVGVAAATMAANDYGWVRLGVGVFEAIVVNAVAADSNLTTTGTAGQAGTGGDAISSCINIDAGVTDTRVTVRCTGFASTNLP